MTSTVKLTKNHLTFDVNISDLDKSNFKSKGCKIIHVDGFKGIVFNFTNDDLIDPFFRIVTGSTNILNLKATVKNTPDLNWNVGDYVRIMFLNEIDYRDFEKLVPYFEARLKFYKYDNPLLPNSNLLNYSDFSKAWNVFNPNNPIDDIQPTLSPIPRQTHNDDILRII